MSARITGRAALGLLALGIILLGAAAAVVRVPDQSLSICGRPGAGAARRRGPGLQFRIPLLETCVLFKASPIEISGTVTLASDEGATLEAEFRFQLDPRSAEPATLLDGSPGGDIALAGRTALQAALGAIDSRTPVGRISPLKDPASRRLMEERLAPLGLVPASLTLGDLHPRSRSTAESASSGPLGALLSSYRGSRYPVLVVGIDSADWGIMGPMIERGELPALRAIKERGAWGSLRSATPTLSPLLWTTVATGKTPDQHGIVDFLAHDPGSGRQVPITSRFRKAGALWSILSGLGIPSLTVGWWATWPAEKVVGEMVTDRVSYSLLDAGAGAASSRTTYPPALAAEIERLIVRPADITLAEAKRIVEIGEDDFERARGSLGDAASWREPAAHLLRILAATRTYHQVALDRLRARQPALSLVYYEGLDEVNHRFAAYVPPAMRWADPAKAAAYRGAVGNFYRLQDRMVGELIAAADPNSVVIVISDHGFASGDRRPTDVPPDIEGKPGRWHTLDGVILAAGPTIEPGRMLRDPALIDIAPTILSLLSLPRAADMPGRAVPEIVRPGAVPDPPAPEIASYEILEGARGGEVADGAPSAADDEMLAKLTALGYIGSAGEAHGPPSASAPGGAVPGTVTGHLNAANALLAGLNYREAEPEYRAALEIAPDYVPARLGLAQCLIATGREAEGWRRLASILEEGRDLDSMIYMKVAAFYRRRGRAGEGAALFERLPRREGLEPARLTASGMLLDAAGDREGALHDLRAALRGDPAFTEALREMYRILTAEGDGPALMGILETARRARPEGVVAANLLALTYERADRRKEAVALLRHLLESSPRDVPTLANLAGMLARGGDVASALSLLRRARDVEPANVEVTANLLVTLGSSKDLAAAREIYRSAGAASERTELLNAMAYACYVNGDLAEARDLVTRSLRRDPGQPEARKLLTSIEGAGGRSPSSAKEPGL